MGKAIIGISRQWRPNRRSKTQKHQYNLYIQGFSNHSSASGLAA
jgi:hypothetical protein